MSLLFHQSNIEISGLSINACFLNILDSLVVQLLFNLFYIVLPWVSILTFLNFFLSSLSHSPKSRNLIEQKFGFFVYKIKKDKHFIQNIRRGNKYEY